MDESLDFQFNVPMDESYDFSAFEDEKNITPPTTSNAPLTGSVESIPEPFYEKEFSKIVSTIETFYLPQTDRLTPEILQNLITQMVTCFYLVEEAGGSYEAANEERILAHAHRFFVLSLLFRMKAVGLQNEPLITDLVNSRHYLKAAFTCLNQIINKILNGEIVFTPTLNQQLVTQSSRYLKLYSQLFCILRESRLANIQDQSPPAFFTQLIEHVQHDIRHHFSPGFDSELAFAQLIKGYSLENAEQLVSEFFSDSSAPDDQKNNENPINTVDISLDRFLSFMEETLTLENPNMHSLQTINQFAQTCMQHATQLANPTFETPNENSQTSLQLLRLQRLLTRLFIIKAGHRDSPLSTRGAILAMARMTSLASLKALDNLLAQEGPLNMNEDLLTSFFNSLSDYLNYLDQGDPSTGELFQNVPNLNRLLSTQMARALHIAAGRLFPQTKILFLRSLNFEKFSELFTSQPSPLQISTHASPLYNGPNIRSFSIGSATTPSPRLDSNQQTANQHALSLAILTRLHRDRNSSNNSYQSQSRQGTNPATPQVWSSSFHSQK